MNKTFKRSKQFKLAALNKHRPQPKAPPPAPVSIPLISKAVQNKDKLLWFSDPHLLREHIDHYNGRSNIDFEALIDLTLRHKGAANNMVYHSLFKLLLTKSKHNLAWRLYSNMLKQNKQPSDQSFTLLLFHLSKQAKGVPKNHASKKKFLDEATELWETIEYKSVVHFNAYLACIEQGGWESAWDLYIQATNRDLNATFKFKPDLVSFTMMLTLANQTRSNEGFYAAFEIWNDFLVEKDNETLKKPNSSKLKMALDVDERILSQILLACIRVKYDIEASRMSLKIINQFFGLPITPTQYKPENEIKSLKEDSSNLNNTKFQRGVQPLKEDYFFKSNNKFQKDIQPLNEDPSINKKFQQYEFNFKPIKIPLKSLSPQTFDILLRIAMRTREFLLGKRWFEILTNRENNLPVDDILRLSYVNLLIECNDFKSALTQTNLVPQNNRFNNIIKTCAASIAHFQREVIFDSPDRLACIKVVTDYLEAIRTREKLKDVFVDINIFRNFLFVVLDGGKHFDWGCRFIKSYKSLIFEKNTGRGRFSIIKKKFLGEKLNRSYHEHGVSANWDLVKVIGYKTDDLIVVKFESLILARHIISKRQDYLMVASKNRKEVVAEIEELNVLFGLIEVELLGFRAYFKKKYDGSLNEKNQMPVVLKELPYIPNDNDGFKRI